MMRTLLTAVVLVPLGVLILLFALANRQAGGGRGTGESRMLTAKLRQRR